MSEIYQMMQTGCDCLPLSDGHQETDHPLMSLIIDEFVLYGNTRQANCSFSAPTDRKVACFFENQFKQIAAILDKLIELVKTADASSPFSLYDFLEVTHVSGPIPPLINARNAIEELYKMHLAILSKLRQIKPSFPERSLGQEANELILSIIDIHERMAHTLKSYFP